MNNNTKPYLNNNILKKAQTNQLIMNNNKNP